MTIGTNVNNVVQSSDIKAINATSAVLIVAADDNRTKLSVALPLNSLTMSAIISATEVEANALKGEMIGQTFPSNASIFMPKIVFDMDSAAQGAKWAIVDDSLTGAETSFSVLINEYTG